MLDIELLMEFILFCFLACTDYGDGDGDCDGVRGENYDHYDDSFLIV